MYVQAEEKGKRRRSRKREREKKKSTYDVYETGITRTTATLTRPVAAALSRAMASFVLLSKTEN